MQMSVNVLMRAITYANDEIKHSNVIQKCVNLAQPTAEIIYFEVQDFMMYKSFVHVMMLGVASTLAEQHVLTAFKVSVTDVVHCCPPHCR